jgi:hypothetical protein
VKKMEASERFRQPVIKSESVQKDSRQGNAQVYKFEIETFYRPAGTPVRAAAREGL